MTVTVRQLRDEGQHCATRSGKPREEEYRKGEAGFLRRTRTEEMISNGHSITCMTESGISSFESSSLLFVHGIAPFV
jgi:hypothetical protein